MADKRSGGRGAPTGGGGDDGRGLGLLGAVVWYRQQADGVGEHVD
jgi:hypothetical protein